MWGLVRRYRQKLHRIRPELAFVKRTFCNRKPNENSGIGHWVHNGEETQKYSNGMR